LRKVAEEKDLLKKKPFVYKEESKEPTKSSFTGISSQNHISPSKPEKEVLKRSQNSIEQNMRDLMSMKKRGTSKKKRSKSNRREDEEAIFLSGSSSSKALPGRSVKSPN